MARNRASRSTGDMTDPGTLRAMPPQSVPPESGPTAPRWAPLLVILVAGIGVATFVVGLPPITYADDPTPMTCVDDGRVCTDVDGTDTIFIECGSVFLPNLVSTSDIGECEGALLVRRITIGVLASAAILLALLGAKKEEWSRVVDRVPTLITRRPGPRWACSRSAPPS
jgi:hypothetical protein